MEWRLGQQERRANLPLPERLFAHLTRGAILEGRPSNLYLYNHTGKSVTCSASNAPWPPVWLCCFKRKNVDELGVAINLDKARSCLMRFEDTLRWVHYTKGICLPAPLLSKRIGDTRVFPYRGCPPLEAWRCGLRDVVTQLPSMPTTDGARSKLQHWYHQAGKIPVLQVRTVCCTNRQRARIHLGETGGRYCHTWRPLELRCLRPG